LHLEKVHQKSNNWDAGNVRKNSGHRGGIACLLHRMAEGIDRGNWTLLKQILKVTAIGCRERNLISKSYMDHSLKCTQEAWRLDEETVVFVLNAGFLVATPEWISHVHSALIGIRIPKQLKYSNFRFDLVYRNLFSGWFPWDYHCLIFPPIHFHCIDSSNWH
jgi:hypothetical protein